MPPKKPAGKGKPAAKKHEEEEDWDAILSAEQKSNIDHGPVAEDTKPEPAKPPAGADDGDSGDEEDGGGDTTKKDKKRKKKKGKKDASAAAEPTSSAAPTSAAAKAILLRRQQQAEEEARIKALQEEQERLIREEEEREAEAARLEAEEKERRRKAKADKVEAQKAAGTYMTKAEKEKAKKAQARLEAMRAAGHVLPTDNADAPSAVKPSDLYKNAKKKGGKGGTAQTQNQTQDQTQQDGEGLQQGSESADPAASAGSPTHKAEATYSSTAAPAAAFTAEGAPAAAASGVDGDVADDWDAGSDDDWETGLNLDQLAVSVSARQEAVAEDVEDLAELEKKKEQEQLRQLGLERARRDEELRIKREEEEREQAEIEARHREAAMRKETSRRNRKERDERAREARSPACLRAPISCIMGHVDTGKTSLLDKIRRTNVQEGEAGGITQQIGVTAFSKDTLSAQTACLQEKHPFNIDLPGLLVIDTPGHESFTNLRSRGSSLCDIAILVIDLMHTLEPQTIESINMLRKNRTPFIVALNKVDRCYGWKSEPNAPIRESLARQDENCRAEFKDRSERAIVALMELGMNASLYWDNDDLAHTVSLVPTSAITGEGIPDILMLLITLTQLRLREQLMYMEVLQCTVLEVKVIEGMGHTVDVVLVNGTLREGDTIVLSTMDGPVVTNIRALLTPPPSREMRVKSEYLHHETLRGAMGVKIVAPEVGRVIAGTSVLVVQPGDDLDDVKEDVQTDIANVKKALETDNRGVMVHASTLGALEALLQFLRIECKPPIPVNHVNIGPIHKKDVMRANIMNEKKLPEFATILAFDVSVDSEARDLAEESNVRIFSADIIYHLFDQFTRYMDGLREERKREAQDRVVFPCVLKILPQYIFNKKDPIVLGVEVLEGTLRVGTPLCIPQLSMLDVGRVTRVELNHKEIPLAKKSAQVSVRIENSSNPTLYYGRQFDHNHSLYSKVSRGSIDACKEFFQADMTKEDWQLIIKLKKVFNIS